MEDDPDIAREREDLRKHRAAALPSSSYFHSLSPERREYRFVPLIVTSNSFQGDHRTAELLQEIGGLEALRKLTGIFYKKAFNDSHLDQFIRSHNDPHGERLANWIAEKMDPSNKVWTAERSRRDKIPVKIQGGEIQVHDRSSAHVAAWHSVKRKPDRVGIHFELHDARTWMRLMFWSGRESGIFEASPTFEDWYVRFIAHFVKVYERLAPPFARDSFRWAKDANNIEQYVSNGYKMNEDILGPHGEGIAYRVAAFQIPKEERNDSIWPYNNER